MTPINFEKQLKKGNLAESIIIPRMEFAGWICYKAVTQGAHWIDVIAFKGKGIGKMGVDIKSKSKMLLAPHINCTGINQQHFEEYKKFNDELYPVWLIFIDDNDGEIYGNTLDNLEIVKEENNRKYPTIINDGRDGRQIRIWHYSSMQRLGYITSEEKEMLKKLSQKENKNE